MHSTKRGCGRAAHLTAWAGVMLLFVAHPAMAQYGPSVGAASPVTLDSALHEFYSGRYVSAAEISLSVRDITPRDLLSYDVRTSSLHFQLRRAMGDGEDRDKLYKACTACPAIVQQFMDEFTAGRAAARERVAADPADLEALFFLGRLDLSYVWLKLGTVGQRTGWNEYWEARRSLDGVLKVNPAHPRARIARAWIDYIVDTKMTRGFRWILGGGNRKRALATLREVAASPIARYERAEAGFALWDMEQREKNLPAAVVVAQGLSREFPDNEELIKFLARHDGVAAQTRQEAGR